MNRLLSPPTPMPLPTYTPSSPPPTPTVLRARCRRPGALWCHATLGAATLELRTWTVRGPVDRSIPLEVVRGATWRSEDARGAVLQIALDDETLEIKLRGAALWKLAIDERARRATPPPAPVPERPAGYRHRAVYAAPDFGTELVERPLAPLVPIASGDGYHRLPELTRMR